MRKHKYICFLFALLCICVLPQWGFAWYSDPKINTAVGATESNQFEHASVSDGAGGVVIAWVQKVGDSDSDLDIYAQRLDSHGEPVWASAVPICTAAAYQGFPKMVSDARGGAIIVWHDSRAGFNSGYTNFDIYAQRVTSDGQIAWQENGVPICTAANWQVYPHLTSDGSGGAIIAWDDGRTGNCQDYVQRVNASGVVMWQANGVLVADNEHAHSDPDIAADGSGGAIVSWLDYRTQDGIDVYVQRFDSSGNRLWGSTGVGLCTEINEQFGARVAADGTGGAVISWADARSGSDALDIYAQKINASGAIVWAENGIPVCSAIGSQVTNAIISDGVGGVIIAWEDGRKQTGDTDIYAQRLTEDGVPVWGENGMPVCATDEVQIRPSLISDGAGGTIITWQDFYRGGTSWNVYAQRISEAGVAQWTGNGVPVCTADQTQSDPLITTDSQGGGIIVWYDARSGTYYNIYAQLIDKLGVLGGGEFRFYTADREGQPKTVFSPGEIIRFNVSWTVTASEDVGSYNAIAAMVIQNSQIYRQLSTDYEVQDASSE